MLALNHSAKLKKSKSGENLKNFRKKISKKA